MRRYPSVRDRASERGAALLLVVVVIAVIVVVGFALLNKSTAENDAIGSKRRYDRAVSCADAARDYLLSQFRTYGVSPTSLQISRQSGDQTFGTGHYDQIGIAGTITKAEGFSQQSFGATDISNRIARTGLGGQVYRIIVACSSGTGSSAHQSEVEFLVRFGL